MLKINSTSAEEYQRFIFKFKQHALFDYADACFSGKEPFNGAVAAQIRLAIENNFKILNIPDLFNDTEIKEQQQKLTQLQIKLDKSTFAFKPKIKKAPKKVHLFNVNLVHTQGRYLNDNSKSKKATTLPFLSLNNGKELLNNLDRIIANVQENNPAAQFYLLQQLFLELPINFSLPISIGVYSELNASLKQKIKQLIYIL